jgi:hypothetical protein
MDSRLPQPGQRIGRTWRPEGPHNMADWIMGQPVVDFDDLKEGSFYLSDSAFLDRLFLMKISETDTPYAEKRLGTYVQTDATQAIGSVEFAIYPGDVQASFQSAWEVFYKPA